MAPRRRGRAAGAAGRGRSVRHARSPSGWRWASTPTRSPSSPPAPGSRGVKAAITAALSPGLHAGRAPSPTFVGNSAARRQRVSSAVFSAAPRSPRSADRPSRPGGRAAGVAPVPITWSRRFSATNLVTTACAPAAVRRAPRRRGRRNTHRQGARDGRRRHHQLVRRLAPFSASRWLHAEAVLLVDDGQPEPVEFDVPRSARGCRRDRRFATRLSRQSLPALFFDAAGQPGHFDAQRFQPGRELAVCCSARISVGAISAAW